MTAAPVVSTMFPRIPRIGDQVRSWQARRFATMPVARAGRWSAAAERVTAAGPMTRDELLRDLALVAS